MYQGDITRNQCSQATKQANKYLNKPIKLPDQFDKERFHHRVSKLPLSKDHQYIVFFEFYLDQTNSNYGEFIRSHYSNKMLDKIWLNKFNESYIGTPDFEELINNSLLWGFDFTRLCQILNEMNLKDPSKAVKYILDTNIHLKEKENYVIKEIDSDEITPYSIYNQFKQFGYFDEIKHTLKTILGDKCNIEGIIDNYLKEEDKKKLNIQKPHTFKETYDIITCEGLIN